MQMASKHKMCNVASIWKNKNFSKFSSMTDTFKIILMPGIDKKGREKYIFLYAICEP